MRAGIFNGTAVALKSMIGESCDASNQARAGVGRSVAGAGVYLAAA